ncbi:DUF2163 domain-containing protein [Falsihalocynthiibacter sp. S25ZX9]|uniref:DUF2163 domain-containing protein n=1 Tax=Falsihalocynthiibacter sp. S25ZX9 TaxID=3240870 RepID=UPI00350EA83B
MTLSPELKTHLKSGITSVSRCWAVTRTDGISLGFTDHDENIAFDGVDFLANTGLTARALQQTTGLAVDNTEALGALNSDTIREEDIAAGRYDGAQVLAWLVNWQNPIERTLQFRGTIGELTRGDGAFQAELRGLTEALNQPQGRTYQKPCSAVLGDHSCRFNLDTAGYVTTRPVETIKNAREMFFDDFLGFDDRWFERGRFEVLSGNAKGLIGFIKNDRLTDKGRTIELWEALRLSLDSGDLVRFEAGCDKRVKTCQLKFQNFLNYQGFPDIPGEDWLMSYPSSGDVNEGGQLVSSQQTVEVG